MSAKEPSKWQPQTRVVSTRAAHLARWKYADPTGRILYRDAPDPSLRLIRPPEGEQVEPAAPKTEPETTKE